MVPATLPVPAAKATPTIPSILALDLGTTTGWAIRNDRCRILHGTAEFRPSRFEGGGMRYLRFGKWLDQTLEVTGGINAIHYEEVRRHTEPVADDRLPTKACLVLEGLGKAGHGVDLARASFVVDETEDGFVLAQALGVIPGTRPVA